MIDIILFPPKHADVNPRPWQLEVQSMPRVGDLFAFDSLHTFPVEVVLFCCPKERGGHRCDIHVKLGVKPKPATTPTAAAAAAHK